MSRFIFCVNSLLQFVRLQDLKNLDSTQESEILDEAKINLEHNKNQRFLCRQNMKYFEVLKNQTRHTLQCMVLDN